MKQFVLLASFLSLTFVKCTIDSHNLFSKDIPYDFQNELNLQTAINSEMTRYKQKLNDDLHNPTSSGLFKFDINSPLYLDESDMEVKYDNNTREKLCAKNKPPSIKTTTPTSTTTEKKEVYTMEPIPSCTLDTNNFLGTNLFGPHRKKCFSVDDFTLLKLRYMLEDLFPKYDCVKLLTNKKVCMLMRYFNKINDMVDRINDAELKFLAQRAFYDTIGGYLRTYLLPAARMSLYAGELKLCTVQRIDRIFKECKNALNTYGSGWQPPPTFVPDDIDAEPLDIKSLKSGDMAANCAMLDLEIFDREALNMQMIVPLPHLEQEDYAGNINNVCFPFKRRHIFNVQMSRCSFIFVKFYKVLTRCYQFQGMCMDTYNEKLLTWFLDNLTAHLNDEIVYPGLAGALRVYATLKRLVKKNNSTVEPGGDCIGRDPDYFGNIGNDFDVSEFNENDDIDFESNTFNKKRANNCASNGKKDPPPSNDVDEGNDICAPCDRDFNDLKNKIESSTRAPITTTSTTTATETNSNDRAEDKTEITSKTTNGVKVETTTSTTNGYNTTEIEETTQILLTETTAKVPFYKSKLKFFKTSLVTYLTIFLGIMFALLIIFICCFFMKSKTDTQQQPDRIGNVDNDNDDDDYDSNYLTTTSDIDASKKKKKSGCSGLFIARRKARQRLDRNKRNKKMKSRDRPTKSTTNGNNNNKNKKVNFSTGDSLPSDMYRPTVPFKIKIFGKNDNKRHSKVLPKSNLSRIDEKSTLMPKAKYEMQEYIDTSEEWTPPKSSQKGLSSTSELYKGSSSNKDYYKTSSSDKYLRKRHVGGKDIEKLTTTSSGDNIAIYS